MLTVRFGLQISMKEEDLCGGDETLLLATKKGKNVTVMQLSIHLPRFIRLLHNLLPSSFPLTAILYTEETLLSFFRSINISATVSSGLTFTFALHVTDILNPKLHRVTF